ncbi:MAG: hypothetical protein GPJ52_00480 [Candidatus Heimdallarchaeota archaeon]|nr:hypothetical protein [Candidatus Heimdallarchaeota archaeon]MCG3253869.1 zinc ribbon domain-containing protein [Candidatus Heimdallarchaeota archaeon]MCK4291003.1 zinc ribbon domain-containing protein [Candidatus Heimdallarchaeota archaeon]
MTIFCPSCGTANRDEAEMCSECGNVIPRLTDNSLQQPEPTSPPPNDFGVTEATESEFGINVGYPPPPPPPGESDSSSYPAGYPPYDHRNAQSLGRKTVCERCGTVLRADDKQCSGCGKPNPTAVETPSPYSIPQQPYQTGEPYSPPTPYAPQAPPRPSPPPPPPQDKEKSSGKPQQKIAKCSSCGAIVYDYETRCSNCDRILSPPTRPSRDAPQPEGQAPAGTARCSRCNAIVYPHQTKCPNCDKPLSPIPTDSGPKRPSQRISRCRRCSHIVYPTDTRCQNCGRKLDSV